MDSTQFAEAARTVTDDIIRYNHGVQDRQVSSNVEPGYLKSLLPDDPPTAGEEWADIQKDIEEKIMPGITHWQVVCRRGSRSGTDGKIQAISTFHGFLSSLHLVSKYAWRALFGRTSCSSFQLGLLTSDHRTGDHNARLAC